MYPLMNLQLASRWFYYEFSIISFCIASIRSDGSHGRFLFYRLYSDRPADRFNCTWSLLLFVEPVLLISLRDHFARSTGVCFRVPPSLFYSLEGRRYLRPHTTHTLFRNRQTRSLFAKNDHVDRIMSTN